MTYFYEREIYFCHFRNYLTNFVQIQNPIIKDIKGYLTKKKKITVIFFLIFNNRRIKFFSWKSYTSAVIKKLQKIFIIVAKSVLRKYENHRVFNNINFNKIYVI